MGDKELFFFLLHIICFSGEGEVVSCFGGKGGE